ncbi:KIF-1 binding protein C terminal [Trypanosoma brucei equiperdum]|uniref:KIF-binding protein n=2 Tax=Trypanosoma brucei TaxID=5691 RepID=A0A3L6LAJ8_9TRYP|nr:KIF-1 binding protein C terminal [Trypanosoma brucei equiperdum]
MDHTAFTLSYDAIVKLSEEEGPRRNVLEPKFTARSQMQSLRDSVVNAYRESPSFTALSQVCRCGIFIGLNMLETSEEEEGMTELRKAYSVTLSGAKEELLADVENITPHPIELILQNEAPYIDATHRFAFATEFLRVHNALGLYFSNRDATLRLNDAKQVLHVAEKGYNNWNKWFESLPGSCVMQQVPVKESGGLDRESISTDALTIYTARYEMDTAFTSTLFFLAQVYSASQMTAMASRYCHRTLYSQLLNKMEFSKKDWATNALHLSAFYSSYYDYGKALHCLSAGRFVMPKENPTEETLGVVAWAHGRFYLHRLQHYADVKRGCASRAPLPDELEGWWEDFPLDIPPPEFPPIIETFDDARECFKTATNWFNEALKFYVYDGCCTEHIEIMKDKARLYEVLIHFETGRDRIIAMHQRRVTLLEKFPDDLSFKAYPTLVRQLLFDLGVIHEEVVELRIRQRSDPVEGEKPLSDKNLNALVRVNQSFYRRFCDTWKDPKSGVVPEVLESESRMPFFRAAMRLAQLQLKFVFKNPREEFENISVAIQMFQKAVDFASANPMEDETEKEVQLSREMIDMLPLKQRDLLRVYNRTA